MIYNLLERTAYLNNRQTLRNVGLHGVIITREVVIYVYVSFCDTIALFEV